jgi:hypothetical protein
MFIPTPQNPIPQTPINYVAPVPQMMGVTEKRTPTPASPHSNLTSPSSSPLPSTPGGSPKSPSLPKDKDQKQKSRKKWNPEERVLFDNIYQQLAKECKYVRPRLIQKKLEEQNCFVTRDQISSFLQVTLLFVNLI